MSVVFPLIMRAPPVDPLRGSVADAVPAASWSWPVDGVQPSCPAGTPADGRGPRGTMHRPPLRSNPPATTTTRSNMTTRVSVVGGVIMWSGIAEVSARAGYDVLVREVDDSAAEAAQRRLDKSLARAVRAGKFTEADRESAAARLSFTTELDDLSDR